MCHKHSVVQIVPVILVYPQHIYTPKHKETRLAVKPVENTDCLESDAVYESKCKEQILRGYSSPQQFIHWIGEIVYL